ncbi:MAG TPA: cupin domain-containing protein [Terriglobia bacterium]|nr:cupin domain-containing protein [Terriglobia bacterium]
MMNRRDVNSTLASALAGLLSGKSGALLWAEKSPAQQNSPDQRQNTSSIVVQTLMKESLAEIPNAELKVSTLTIPPGAPSLPHRHTGPVFAYVLEGEVENQVDPSPPQRYKAGEYFYETPMHVHRLLRNLSGMETAKLLIFEVGEKGKQFTISAD